jgi:hypothetical protein
MAPRHGSTIRHSAAARGSRWAITRPDRHNARRQDRARPVLRLQRHLFRLGDAHQQRRAHSGRRGSVSPSMPANCSPRSVRYTTCPRAASRAAPATPGVPSTGSSLIAPEEPGQDRTRPPWRPRHPRDAPERSTGPQGAGDRHGCEKCLVEGRQCPRREHFAGLAQRLIGHQRTAQRGRCPSQGRQGGGADTTRQGRKLRSISSLPTSCARRPADDHRASRRRVRGRIRRSWPPIPVWAGRGR